MLPRLAARSRGRVPPEISTHKPSPAAARSPEKPARRATHPNTSRGPALARRWWRAELRRGRGTTRRSAAARPRRAASSSAACASPCAWASPSPRSRSPA
eukprot:5816591-Prymnesium_polylepis.1